MRYRFADLEFEFGVKGMPIALDEMCAPFISDKTTTADFVYYEKPLVPQMLHGSRQIKYAGGYELLQTENGMFHLNHWATCRKAYGFFTDDLATTTPIYVNETLTQEIPIAASYFLSTVGLHRKLLCKGAVVLHCSYIEHNGKAILFLGPSGTGKSTQAQLWEKYEKAQIINGDRALLRSCNGRWMVYGYPCCGSSSICINKTLPLAALVVLQQGKENMMEPLSAARKICALTAATEVYPWDSWEVTQAFDAAQNLSASIPMFQFSCTKDQRAVETLKVYLETIIV